MPQPTVPREPRRTPTSQAKQPDTSGTHAWLVLMKAFRALAQHAEQSMGGAELALSEFTILEALLNKGPLQVNDIGRRVNLTSGAITSAIDRLEDRALVQRGVDAADKRARLVSLTRAGRALIGTAFNAHKARMDAVADTLTAKERKTLIGLLKKLGLGAAEKLAKTAGGDRWRARSR